MECELSIEIQLIVESDEDSVELSKVIARRTTRGRSLHAYLTDLPKINDDMNNTELIIYKSNKQSFCTPN